MDDPFARGTVEGALEIFWALYRQGVQRDSCRPCGRLRGTKLEFADGGISKHPQIGKRRHGFFEKFNLFATELRQIEEQSRKVTARASKTSAHPLATGSLGPWGRPELFELRCCWRSYAPNGGAATVCLPLRPRSLRVNRVGSAMSATCPFYLQQLP